MPRLGAIFGFRKLLFSMICLVTIIVFRSLDWVTGDLFIDALKTLIVSYLATNASVHGIEFAKFLTVKKKLEKAKDEE